MTTAVDTETFLIFPGNLAPAMVCKTWARGDDKGILHHSDPELLKMIRRLLEHEHITGAFICFDLAVFCAWDPTLIPLVFKALDEGRVHDVQVREKLIDLAKGCFRFEENEDGEIKAKGYSLAELSYRYFKHRMDKDTWRLRYHELYDTPLEDWPEGAKEYATDDAVLTLMIHEEQARSHADYLGDEASQVRSLFALYLTSCRGLMTDPEMVDALERRTLEEIAKIKDQLIDAKLVRKDGTRDTKAATRYMIEVAGDDVMFTDKAYQLGLPMDEVLELAKEKGRYIKLSKEATIEVGDDVLRSYSRYTQLNNLLRGSVKDFRGGTVVPIQSKFEVLQKTGRTGSSSPNIQNLRTFPGVRECFRAREGYAILSGDYSAAELHTLAQVCYDEFGASELGDALNSGIDVHCQMGAHLVGCDYEEFLAGIKEDPKGEFYKPRQLAKAANFGFPGGCSPLKFIKIAKQYGVEIDLREAQRARTLYFRSWPEMNAYFELVRSCYEDRPDGRWYWVRHTRSQLLVSRLTYTSACNARFQGLAARGAKAGHYALVKECFTNEASALWGSYVVNFVHDENLLETPLDHVSAAARRMATVMEDEFNVFTPDCPVKVEVAAMIHWNKAAKPVYSDGGELQVWYPKEAA